MKKLLLPFLTSLSITAIIPMVVGCNSGASNKQPSNQNSSVKVFPTGGYSTSAYQQPNYTFLNSVIGRISHANLTHQTDYGMTDIMKLAQISLENEDFKNIMNDDYVDGVKSWKWDIKFINIQQNIIKYTLISKNDSAEKELIINITPNDYNSIVTESPFKPKYSSQYIDNDLSIPSEELLSLTKTRLIKTNSHQLNKINLDMMASEILKYKSVRELINSALDKSEDCIWKIKSFEIKPDGIYIVFDSEKFRSGIELYSTSSLKLIITQEQYKHIIQ